MNRQELALLIPILALSIPVVAIVMSSLVKMARLKAEGQRTALGPDESLRLAALEDDVAQLRQDLADTHERLDFAERMLAAKSEQGQLKS